MGFPDQEPRASGGYQDDTTIPDNGRYLDDLSPMDSGSAGDMSDRYEDTAYGDTAEDDDDDDYYDDDDDDDESDDLGILGDDELYDEGAEYDPAGFPRQAGRDNGQAGGHRPGMMG
jgi:hypothetical protein